MAITGGVADYARGELPQEWDALQSEYGDPFMQIKIDSVLASLFGGDTIDTSAQDALSIRVRTFIGKLVALELINPAISYWSKQALSVGARGSNESKAYDDRAKYLKDLRAELLAQTRAMLPEVIVELPDRTVNRVAVGPRVRQALGAVTPDPDSFERPYLAPEEITEGTGTL